MITTINGQALRPRLTIDPNLTVLFEDWSTGFDAAIWAETLLGGAARSINVENARGCMVIDYTLPMAAAARATLYTQDVWEQMPEGGLDETGALWGIAFEFEMQMTNFEAFIDNKFFIGFAGVINPTRTTNDIIGFIKNGTDIEALCDDGGVETTAAFPAAIDLTAWHHYKIIVLDGEAHFFIDHTYGLMIDTNVSSIVSYAVMNNENS